MSARLTCVLVVALTGCREGGPVTLPPEPAPLRADPEYLFGSATGGRDVRLQLEVLDQLEPHHTGLRINIRSMNADVRPAALRAHYDAALLKKGWAALPEFGGVTGRGGWAFGYARGRSVLALTGLNARAADGGRVPVTVVTNVREEVGP